MLQISKFIKLSFKISLFLFIFHIILLNNSYSSLRYDIQRLVKQYNLSNADIGISVQRTKNYNYYYGYRSDDLFTPASTNKILVAIGALLILPKNFRYETNVYANLLNLDKNGTLNSNVYIKFSGDPSLSYSSIKKLMQTLQKKGINKIKGNVILIGNKFNDNYIPKGWDINDAKHCYAAPTSTLNINRNCASIEIQNKNGEISIERLSYTYGLKIENDLKSGFCPLDFSVNDRNKLTLKGCLSSGRSKYLSFAIPNPALKTLYTINYLFNDLHIKVDGDIFIGSNIPNYYKKLNSIKSSSLKSMLKHMLLSSDNLYAESFLKTIGYYKYKDGSVEYGIKALKYAFKKNLNIIANNSNMKIYDGSGLSKLDAITPRFLTNILSKSFNNKKINKDLYYLLPVSGQTGTLKYRMGNILNKVKAKTGTLEGVVSLSGYLMTRKIHRLSFTIVLNNLQNDERYKARIFIDKVVHLFYKYL